LLNKVYGGWISGGTDGPFLPSGLEGDHSLCRHNYLFPYAGIACWAELALLDLEHAEVPKLTRPMEFTVTVIAPLRKR
jgi:hypothetical protein